MLHQKEDATKVYQCSKDRDGCEIPFNLNSTLSLYLCVFALKIVKKANILKYEIHTDNCDDK